MTKLIDIQALPMFQNLPAIRKSLDFGIYLVEEGDGDRYVLMYFDPDEPITLHTIRGGELSTKIYVSECRQFRVVCPLNLTLEGPV